MFTSRPTYDIYRALLYVPTGPMRGEDVYAWQTCINAVLDAGNVATDGFFGPQTQSATREVQAFLRIGADGRVGPVSWLTAVDHIGRGSRVRFGLPLGALYGQLGHESGFRGGIYSVLHQAGTPRESWDAGVAQRNSRVFSGLKGSFTVPTAIDSLAGQVKAWYGIFHGVPEKRRWDLAQGAWNAPAYACWYARQEGADDISARDTRDPHLDGQGAVDKFRDYIASVTAYRR